MIQPANVDRSNGIISCPICKEIMTNLTLMEEGSNPPLAILNMTKAGNILQCINPETQHRFKVLGIREQEVPGYEEVLVEEIPVTPGVPGQEGVFESAEGLMKLVEGMPFMPEKGTPLPEYVSKELYGLEAFQAPISGYGREVVNEAAKRLAAFMVAGSFTVVEQLEETGWSSDSIAYNGVLSHSPSGKEWMVELWVQFEWRKPEDIEGMFIDFLDYREPGGEWVHREENIPDELTLNLTAEGGTEASSKVQEYASKGE